MLANDERDALLAPLSGFRFLLRDAITFHFVSELESWQEGPAILSSFDYHRSAGSGAGLSHGNPTYLVGTVFCEGASLPHTFIRPSSLSARLLWRLEPNRALQRVKGHPLKHYLVDGAPAPKVRLLCDALAEVDFAASRASLETREHRLALYLTPRHGGGCRELRPMLERIARALCKGDRDV